MADLTIDELLTSYTADDLYLSSPNGNTGVFVDNLVGLGLPANKWRPGSIASSVTRVVAILYAMFSLVIVAIAKFGFLITSTGGWLRLLARYQYGVEPIFASAATGQVTITNSGGGLYDYLPGELVLEKTSTGKLYKNVAHITINPGATVAGIDVIALELGTSSNAAPGEIDALQEPQIGLTVTNPASIAGFDDESDSALIQRCLDSLGARSVFGPLSAYKTAIADATLLDGTPVNVNRSRVSPYSSTGVVNVVLASPSGPVSLADIAGVVTSIENLAEVDTDTVNVSSAVAIAVSKTLTVWAKKTSGLDSTTLTNEVNAALIDFNENWPVGGRFRTGDPHGWLFDNAIREAAKAADASIWLVESDGIDQPLNLNEVAVLGWTLNIRIVADS